MNWGVEIEQHLSQTLNIRRQTIVVKQPRRDLFSDDHAPGVMDIFDQSAGEGYSAIRGER